MAYEDIDTSTDCTMDRTPLTQADATKTISPYQPRKMMTLMKADGERITDDDMTALTNDLSKSADFSANAATAKAAVIAVVESAIDFTAKEESLKPTSLRSNRVDRWGNSSGHSSSWLEDDEGDDDRSDSVSTFDDNDDDDGSFRGTDSKETSSSGKKSDAPPTLPRHTQLSPLSIASSRASLGRRSSDLGPSSHPKNNLPPGFGGDNVPMKPKRRGSEGSNACSPRLEGMKFPPEMIDDLNLAENDGFVDKNINRSYLEQPADLYDQGDDRWATHKRCSRRLSDVTPFSNSTGTRSSSSNSSGMLTPSEIEAYVMARMPPNLKEKLDPQSWNEIFTAAADSMMLSHNQRRMSSHGQQRRSSLLTEKAARIVSRNDDNTNDEDSVCSNASDFSEITTPTVFHSPQKKSKPSAMSRTTPTPTAAPEIPNEDSGLSRSWHEGRSKSTAPRLPIRECSVRERQHDLSSSLPGDISDYVANDMVDDAPKPRQSVVFGTVTVREYERILEMNPGTSCGPSVGIGWEYVQLDPVGVVARDNDPRRRRRDALELVLSREEREDILLDLGYSSRDLARAVRHILKRRNQRKQTIHNLSKQNMEEMVERSTRKVRKVLFGFKSSKPSQRYSSSSTKTNRLTTR